MIQKIIYIIAIISITVYYLFNTPQTPKTPKTPETPETPTLLKSIKNKIKNTNDVKEDIQFINPAPYETGYITSPQTLANCANGCSANVMYPIQPPYVKYGKWKNGGNCCSGLCDNLIFNSPP